MNTKLIDTNNIQKIREILVNPTININKQDKDRDTYLIHYIKYSKNIEIIKLLLEKSISVNLTDYYGNSALMCFLLNTQNTLNIEIINLLLKKRCRY